MEEENITSEESLASDEDVASLDGEEAVESVGIKDVLSEALGKEFKDDESALKAVKDTFKYVGKAGQEKKALEQKIQALEGKSSGEVAQEIESLKKVFGESQFYSDNPEYKPYKEIISKFGENPAEVIKSDDFKSLYSKVKAYDDSENTKSVLQSNPRLGKITDKMSQAREAVKSGNMQEAETAAVSAVLDAYGE